MSEISIVSMMDVVDVIVGKVLMPGVGRRTKIVGS